MATLADMNDPQPPPPPETDEPASESPLALAGVRVALVGRLASMGRRDAQRLVREHGGIVVDRPPQGKSPATGTGLWIVVAEDAWPNGSAQPKLPEAWRPWAESGALVVPESTLWQRLGLVDDDRPVHRLYTPAMLAELVGVPSATMRRWHQLGLLTAVRQVRRLPYFDFREVAVARRLRELQQAGLSAAAIVRQVASLRRQYPDIERPLAELPWVVEGRRLLLRQGDELVEPSGQLRFDFDALAPPETTSTALTLVVDDDPAAQPPANVDAEPPATAAELCAWAGELEEQGHIERAIDLYRAALAAEGPEAETCFALAELLYRSGQTAAAIERYFMAVELDEDFVEARANLGCVLAETGRLDLAVATFEGALRFHPDYADAHYHLARTLDELGRRAEADGHWRAFLDLAPDSPWAETAVERLAAPAEVR